MLTIESMEDGSEGPCDNIGRTDALGCTRERQWSVHVIEETVMTTSKSSHGIAEARYLCRPCAQWFAIHHIKAPEVAKPPEQ